MAIETRCPSFVRFRSANWIVADHRVISGVLYLVVEETEGRGRELVRADETEVLK